MEHTDYFVIPRGIEGEEHIVVLGRSLGYSFYYEVNIKTGEIKGLYESPLSEVINEAIYKGARVRYEEFEDIAKKLGLKEEHLKELNELDMKEYLKEYEKMVDSIFENLKLLRQED